MCLLGGACVKQRATCLSSWLIGLSLRRPPPPAGNCKYLQPDNKQPQFNNEPPHALPQSVREKTCKVSQLCNAQIQFVRIMFISFDVFSQRPTRQNLGVGFDWPAAESRRGDASMRARRAQLFDDFVRLRGSGAPAVASHFQM